jgi:hypothetical protein
LQDVVQPNQPFSPQRAGFVLLGMGMISMTMIMTTGTPDTLAHLPWHDLTLFSPALVLAAATGTGAECWEMASRAINTVRSFVF